MILEGHPAVGTGWLFQKGDGTRIKPGAIGFGNPQNSNRAVKVNLRDGMKL
jgi:hypothetical protein